VNVTRPGYLVRLASSRRPTSYLNALSGAVVIASVALAIAAVRVALTDPSVVANVVTEADTSMAHSISVVILAIVRNLIAYLG
jgi:hypothetical protein